MEEVVLTLAKYGIDCNMSDMYMYSGLFCCADDINLLPPSVNGLNFMLKLCESFAVKNRILLNPLKSKCMCFNQHHLPSLFSNISFIDSTLAFVDGRVVLGS